MNNQRIEEIAAFLYSSGSSSDVPFRLALSFGMGGADLEKDAFIKLMKFFSSKEEITKESCRKFLQSINE